MLETLKTKLNLLLKKWNEWIFLIPIFSLLLIISPFYLHRLDPTAATFDLGITQKFILGAITVSLASGLASLLIRLNFPKLFDYLFNCLETDINNDYSKEQRKYSALLYIIFFLAVVYAISHF